MFRRLSTIAIIAALSCLGVGALALSAAAAPATSSIAAAAETADVSSTSDEPMVEENPVAEPSANEATPLIVVTGLAVLFAAILMAVRAGSARRVEED